MLIIQNIKVQIKKNTIQPHHLAITTIKILVDFFYIRFLKCVNIENAEKKKSHLSTILRKTLNILYISFLFSTYYVANYIQHNL